MMNWLLQNFVATIVIFSFLVYCWFFIAAECCIYLSDFSILQETYTSFSSTDNLTKYLFIKPDCFLISNYEKYTAL